MWNSRLANLLRIDESLLAGASMYAEDLVRIQASEIKWFSLNAFETKDSTLDYESFIV